MSVGDCLNKFIDMGRPSLLGWLHFLQEDPELCNYGKPGERKLAKEHVDIHCSLVLTADMM